jgi:hypothetical protein
MQAICLNDNPLADAVLDLDWSSIRMDDIATPGSFWLNPPHPKDDDGNRVDVEAVIESYQQFVHQKGEGAADAAEAGTPTQPDRVATGDLPSIGLSDAEHLRDTRQASDSRNFVTAAISRMRKHAEI